MKIIKLFTPLIIFILFSFYISVNAQDSKGNLDNAYKYYNEGKTSDAIQIFENYLKTHKDDINIYLQLAYAYKQIGKTEEAQNYFFYVALNSTDKNQINAAKDEIKFLTQSKNPNNLKTSGDEDELNKGYSLINKGDISSAIQVFEKFKIKHPFNTKVSLQLGYLYNDRKRYVKALDEFEFVKYNSKDKSEVDDATQSVFYLKDIVINNAPLSTDIYFYNIYDSYQQNYIGNFVGHINFKLWQNAYLGPYADVYMDAKSKRDKILNDRYFEGGAFFKYRITDFLGFELRTGYVQEIDYDKISFNYKPLVYMGTRIGSPSPYLSYKNANRIFLYSDIFSTGLYDYKFRNIFGQLQIKEVLRYLTGGFSYLEFYLTQMILADSKKLDYNNYIEAGGGITFKPSFINFPALFIEATNKTYFTGPQGNYFEGPFKNTFQIKAGFLINLKTLL